MEAAQPTPQAAKVHPIAVAPFIGRGGGEGIVGRGGGGKIVLWGPLPYHPSFHWNNRHQQVRHQQERQAEDMTSTHLKHVGRVIINGVIHDCLPLVHTLLTVLLELCIPLLQ